MKTPLQFSILFLLSCLLACTKEKPEDLPTIEVDNKNITFSVSGDSLVADVQLIALETTPNSLVSPFPYQILITKDQRLVLMSGGVNSHIAIFDLRTGKFIKKLEFSGEGPGELSAIHFVTYNSFKNHLEIYGDFQGKEVHVDTDGNFLKDIQVPIRYVSKYYPQEDVSLFTFRLSNNDFFKSKESYQFARYDRSSDSWSAFLPTEPGKEEKRDFRTDYQFSKYKEKVYWFNTFEDHIYTIQDGQIRPGYQIRFSENPAPKDFWKNKAGNSLSEAYDRYNYPYIGGFFMETEKNLILSYHSNEGLPLFAYDKQKQKPLFNTLSFTIDFLDMRLPTPIHVKDDAFLYLLSTKDFIQFMQEHPKPDALPESFRRISKTIKPDDNPLFLTVKLK